MTDAASIDTDPPASAEAWVLVLVPEPGTVPPGRRVAQVLKYAKRVQGMRCTQASATTLPEQLARLNRENAELRERVAKLERMTERPRKPERVGTP